MENNFIQMAVSAGHVIAYTIGTIPWGILMPKLSTAFTEILFKILLNVIRRNSVSVAYICNLRKSLRRISFTRSNCTITVTSSHHPQVAPWTNCSCRISWVNYVYRRALQLKPHGASVQIIQFRTCQYRRQINMDYTKYTSNNNLFGQ